MYNINDYYGKLQEAIASAPVLYEDASPSDIEKLRDIERGYTEKLFGKKVVQLSSPVSTLASSSASPREKPVGINNSGQNCWINAAIQYIASSPTLIEKVLSSTDPRLHSLKQGLSDYLDAQLHGSTSVNL